MEERPIIFSGPMVRAILEDCKTQTRRIIKPRIQLRRPIVSELPMDDRVATLGNNIARINQNGAVSVEGSGGDWLGVKPGEFDWKCPYAFGETTLVDGRWRVTPTDSVLWVRETWGVGTRPDSIDGWRDGVEHKADETYLDGVGLLPLHPVDESVDLENYRGGWRSPIYMPKWACRLRLRVTNVRVERLQEISEEDAEAEGLFFEWDEASSRAYWETAWQVCWDTLNAKRGFGWETNPWVWVISFERIVDSN